MRTFKKHLQESLKDKQFKELFDEEKELLEIALRIQKARKKAGISQQEIAEKAHLTQQQISKLENGINCNILTYLKASRAIGFELSFKRFRVRSLQRPTHRKKTPKSSAKQPR
ncbi:MAG: helix-turn-helix transcriptional regulator [Chitinivibrionales bacterium]|nr:helix-turn-helix transcriptional regulator [Chitinivibrionales bacterium]